MGTFNRDIRDTNSIIRCLSKLALIVLMMIALVAFRFDIRTKTVEFAPAAALAKDGGGDDDDDDDDDGDESGQDADAGPSNSANVSLVAGFSPVSVEEEAELIGN